MPRQDITSQFGSLIPPVREPPVRGPSSGVPARVAVPLADFGAPPVRSAYRGQAGVRATADDSDAPTPKKNPVVVKTTSRELRAQRIVNQWSGPQTSSHREGATLRDGTAHRDGPLLEDVSMDDCGPVLDPIPLDDADQQAQASGRTVEWGVATGFVAGALAAMVLVSVLWLWMR